MIGLEELQKFIDDAQTAVNRILICIDFNKIEIPVIFDLEQALDIFIYMRGWVECLEELTTRQKFVY